MNTLKRNDSLQRFFEVVEQWQVLAHELSSVMHVLCRCVDAAGLLEPFAQIACHRLEFLDDFLCNWAAVLWGKVFDTINMTSASSVCKRNRLHIC